MPLPYNGVYDQYPQSYAAAGRILPGRCVLLLVIPFNGEAQERQGAFQLLDTAHIAMRISLVPAPGVA